MLLFTKLISFVLKTTTFFLLIGHGYDLPWNDGFVAVPLLETPSSGMKRIIRGEGERQRLFRYGRSTKGSDEDVRTDLIIGPYLHVSSRYVSHRRLFPDRRREVKQRGCPHSQLFTVLYIGNPREIITIISPTRVCRGVRSEKWPLSRGTVTPHRDHYLMFGNRLN